MDGNKKFFVRVVCNFCFWYFHNIPIFPPEFGISIERMKDYLTLSFFILYPSPSHLAIESWLKKSTKSLWSWIIKLSIAYLYIRIIFFQKNKGWWYSFPRRSPTALQTLAYFRNLIHKCKGMISLVWRGGGVEHVFDIADGENLWIFRLCLGLSKTLD